jgi:type I restriction enzyme S subunit
VSEWKYYNLSDYYSFSSGLSKGSEYFGSGYDFVSFKDVFDNFFLPETLSAKVQSTEIDRLNLSVRYGDVFLTRTSETEEELGMSSVALKDYPNATFNGFTKRLRPNEECKARISPKFIGYFFRTKEFRNVLTSIASMTTRASLNNSMLNTLQIPTPPLHEQKAIASVLSSLDDKIDLLHRQNKTLEAIAETLFRQWFIEEAGEDWEETTIGEILTAKGGSTPSTNIAEYWDGEIHWTTPKDLSNNNSIYLFDTARKISNKGLAKISSGLLPEGTLLLSSRAPVGYLAFSKVPLAINQGYIAIIDNKGFSKYFIWLWLKSNMEYIQSHANGSTFQEISKTSFKSLQLFVPPRETRNKFDEIIMPFFEKIKLNCIQIRTLEKLRDNLLPKLMSGEVRVNYA